MVLTPQEALLWLPTMEGSTQQHRRGRISPLQQPEVCSWLNSPLSEMLLQDEARFGNKHCWSSRKLSHDAAALQNVSAVQPVIK